jgi:hypothetical protein
MLAHGWASADLRERRALSVAVGDVACEELFGHGWVGVAAKFNVPERTNTWIMRKHGVRKRKPPDWSLLNSGRGCSFMETRTRMRVASAQAARAVLVDSVTTLATPLAGPGASGPYPYHRPPRQRGSARCVAVASGPRWSARGSR